MRLRTHWLMFSIGGGVLLAATLLVFPEALFVSFPRSLDVLTTVVFWPVAVCEHFVGPGAAIGSPSQHLHEGTPLQLLAAVVGVALSWIFWSSLAFSLIAYRSRRNAPVIKESKDR